MKEGMEEEVAKWENLGSMLTGKEELMKTVAKKAENLEDELEKEQWSDAVQHQGEGGDIK